MSERGSDENARSRRLPPLEAWKKPDKWIDLRSGLVKPSISQLVLDTDERGFLDTDQVVEQVEDMLFWKDYDWPYTFDDQETAPDDHHFYYYKSEYSVQSNEGNPIPNRFRELPTVKGTMPRQFHNAIHDFTRKPDMPNIDAMGEYYMSYMLAHRAFKSLIASAKNTRNASQMFSHRRKSLANGTIQLSEHGDVVAQEMMRDFFSKHFEAYSRSVDTIANLEERLLIISDMNETYQHKPHVAIKRLGRYVSQSTINYTPLLRAA